MARKPIPDAARSRFACLLSEHVAAGTRPNTASGEPWTYTALAAEVQSSREAKDFASPRSVSNWCKGTALPQEIEPILRALFGPGDRHADARGALRTAFQAARLEKSALVVARAKRDPAGGRWVVRDEQFTLDRAVRPTDRRAAADPLRAQLQTAIRVHAAALAERARRLANSTTWGALSPAAEALRAIVAAESSAMPDNLGDLYALLLQLGQFLDTDTRVQRDPACADEPLDPDLHGALSTLVRLAAPWLRGFPTVAAWDDAAGRTLVRADLFQPARDFNRIARETGAIPARDADAIARLADAAHPDDIQGRKAGARAVGDVQNLILAGAEAAARSAADPADRPLHVRRALATLEAGRAEVERVAETLPPDLRHALLAIVADVPRADEPAMGLTLPNVLIPDDVERRARDLILAGKDVPTAWRPFIRKLNFSLSNIQKLDLLVVLTSLKTLNLRGTRIRDAAPLAALTSLQYLDLSRTLVRDAGPLAALTDLRSVSLAGTMVSDAAPLAALRNLQTLSLSGTRIHDATPLAVLTDLRSVSLSSTMVRDVGPLSTLKNLQTLILINTPISDAAPLANLTKLEFLDLTNTEVMDIASLKMLKARILHRIHANYI